MQELYRMGDTKVKPTTQTFNTGTYWSRDVFFIVFLNTLWASFHRYKYDFFWRGDCCFP
jgi:hypothetical protein